MIKPRTHRRRALLAALAVLAVACAIELVGFLGWWFATAAPFSWANAAAARASASAGDAVVTGRGGADGADPTRIAGGRCVQHPYLGYVYDASAPELSRTVSKYGFVDDAPPLFERSAERFVVGVTGGSLALLLCGSAEANLIAALQRSPRLKGRRIEIVCLAIGGYKQPQNLLAMQLAMLLGGQFDCVVNLDGFNDVSLLNEDVAVGVPAWFPRSWARLMDTAPTRFRSPATAPCRLSRSPRRRQPGGRCFFAPWCSAKT